MLSNSTYMNPSLDLLWPHITHVPPNTCTQHAIVAVATFADTEEGSFLSGKTLVRAYLDVAFGAKSKDLIPGLCVCVCVCVCVCASAISVILDLITINRAIL